MPRRSRKRRRAKITIMGVGGGGSNAISRMSKESIKGVDLICVNTDAQALDLMDVPIRLQIGEKVTRGLGSGGDPNLGWKAAEESREDILEAVADADMVFVAAGMGGGTGTGAAPVVARLARHSGALTVGVVTKPFSFEGRHRREIAEEGIKLLSEQVDTLVTISNDRLREMCDSDISMMDAFRMVDDVLAQGIQAISDVINVAGEINVDFADVRSIMKDSGQALMAIGTGDGDDRATKATRAVLGSPLLETSIQGATGILLNISGSKDLTLAETNRIAELIGRAANAGAETIFGVVNDPKLEGQIRITLIATGLDSDEDAEAVSKQRRLRRRSMEPVDGAAQAAIWNNRAPVKSRAGFGLPSLFRRRSGRTGERSFR